MSKFGNRKVSLVIDGKKIIFDSIAERARAVELISDKAITDLVFQPKFLLHDQFIRGGKKIREINYIADFQYQENGELCIEDVKGMQTTEYKLKKKMFLKIYPHRFVESRLIKGRFEKTIY